MAIESSSIHRQKKAIEGIRHQRRLLKAIPIAAGLLPFVPAFIPVAGGILAGLSDAYFRRQEARTIRQGINDSRYQTRQLEDCQIARSTFLGMAQPLDVYKDGLQQYENLYGRLSGDLRRSYLADALPSFSPLMLPDDLFTRHLAMIGQTGVGKTETMLSMLWNITSRGGGALIFEAKGGKDVPVAAYRMLEAQGRPQDFRFLNFEDIYKSHSYNPVFSGSPRSMINTGMMVLPNDGDEFFRDVNRYGLTAAIVCLKHQPGNPTFNIKDLCVVLSDLKEFIRLYEKMPETSKEFIQARQFIAQFLSFWKTTNRDGEEYMNTDLYQTRLMGLVAKLSAFTHSEFGELINSYSPDIDLRKAIEEGQVVVISFSSLGDAESTALFGKLAMADFARAVGDVHAAGTKPAVPFMAFLDEYPSFKAEFHEKLWQLARSSNVAMVLSAQGYNFLANESEHFAKNILANCWNHLFYDVKDPDTRDYAKKLSQTVINLFEQNTESENIGHSQGSESSGVVTQMSSGRGVSKGYKATREELLQPDDMILEEGDAILLGKSATYRVRLPLIEWEKESYEWDEIELDHWDRKGNGLGLWEKAYERNRSFRQFL